MDKTRHHIIIGICTFKRKRLLPNLLKDISRLSLPKEIAVSFILVNNHAPDHSDIETIFNGVDFPFSSVYFITEPEQGISQARNRVLKKAYDLNATEIAMVDDDCRVPDNWLMELYKAYKSCSADVVQGVVTFIFPKNANRYVKNYFKTIEVRMRQKPKSNSASTRSVLFNTYLPNKKKLYFDERFSKSGGGDSFFFQTLYKAGGTIVCASPSNVYEYVPPSRSTLFWLLARKGRKTNCYISNKRNDNKSKTLIIASAYFVKHIFLSLVNLPLLLGSKPSALVHLSKATGALLGLLGYQYTEYTSIAYQNEDFSYLNSSEE